jgi:hypothetical protein
MKRNLHVSRFRNPTFIFTFTRFVSFNVCTNIFIKSVGAFYSNSPLKSTSVNLKRRLATGRTGEGSEFESR